MYYRVSNFQTTYLLLFTFIFHWFMYSLTELSNLNNKYEWDNKFHKNSSVITSETCGELKLTRSLLFPGIQKTKATRRVHSTEGNGERLFFKLVSNEKKRYLLLYICISFEIYNSLLKQVKNKFIYEEIENLPKNTHKWQNWEWNQILFPFHCATYFVKSEEMS